MNFYITQIVVNVYIHI